jgi:hypothetical protein
LELFLELGGDDYSVELEVIFFMFELGDDILLVFEEEGVTNDR